MFISAQLELLSSFRHAHSSKVFRADFILVQTQRHHGESFATWIFLKEIKDILGVSIVFKAQQNRQTNKKPNHQRLSLLPWSYLILPLNSRKKFPSYSTIFSRLSLLTWFCFCWVLFSALRCGPLTTCGETPYSESGDTGICIFHKIIMHTQVGEPLPPRTWKISLFCTRMFYLGYWVRQPYYYRVWHILPAYQTGVKVTHGNVGWLHILGIKVAYECN